MYFIVDALSALDRIYHYTMGTFVSIMVKGAHGMLCNLLPLAVSKEPCTYGMYVGILGFMA